MKLRSRMAMNWCRVKQSPTVSDFKSIPINCMAGADVNMDLSKLTGSPRESKCGGVLLVKLAREQPIVQVRQYLFTPVCGGMQPSPQELL